MLRAVTLINGQPFGPEAGAKGWTWIDCADNHPRCHMSANIGDAVREAVRLAMDLERFNDALDILEKGRLADPYSDMLASLHVEVLGILDQRPLAETIVSSYEERMAEEFEDEEPPTGPREALERMKIAS